MSAPHWLDQFAAELRRQHLPAGYRARLLDELADHLSELEQETTSMEAQLLLEERIGRPDIIAAEARSEYTRRTFAGRHPVLTFGVAPIPILLATLISLVLAMWLIVWCVGMTTPSLLDRNSSPSFLQLCVVYSVVVFMRSVPFALVAWFLARTGRRAQRPIWGFLSCAIVAAMAFLFFMNINPGPGALHGQVFMGLAVYQFPNFHIEQWLQAALPLAIGGWTLWSMLRAERDTNQLSSPA